MSGKTLVVHFEKPTTFCVFRGADKFLQYGVVEPPLPPPCKPMLIGIYSPSQALSACISFFHCVAFTFDVNLFVK